MNLRRIMSPTLAVLAGITLLPIATAAQADTSPPAAQAIGGTPVPNGKYPFIAALQKRDTDESADRQFCGGSLLLPNVILTAAHCAENITPENVGTISVVVGRTTLSNAGQGETRKIAASNGSIGVAIHPKFKTARDYDVAVLLLDRPVTTVEPIQLVTPGTDALESPGRMLTLAGWGNTTKPSGGVPTSPDRMHEVDVPVVSREECAIAYDGIAELTDRDLCAVRTNKAACHGDSGSPLFTKVPNRESFVQVGVVSRGPRSCATTGFPSVYTKLSNQEIGSFLSLTL